MPASWLNQFRTWKVREVAATDAPFVVAADLAVPQLAGVPIYVSPAGPGRYRFRDFYLVGLPLSIVLLLFLSAIVAMVQIGMQHGTLNEREVTTGVGFVILVCLCVWVTLDLNQPQSGMITVSQEPMQRLLSSLSQ